jgi:sugar lactone lactonase YvrE
MSFRIPKTFGVIFAAGLAACSGGGGGGGTPMPPAPAPKATVELFAGLPSGGGNADGTGVLASFRTPTGIVTDPAGNAYVADGGNHTIRKITPAGQVTTFAGSAGVSGAADGVGSAARFTFPRGIARDPAGNLYVLDGGSTTPFVLRRISPSGTVATLATSLFHEPFGLAADIAADGAGAVYIVDRVQSVIWRVNQDGHAAVFAGAPGESGSTDGPGTSARFGSPAGVAVDAAGNVFVSDSANHTLRKITPAGLVSTYAGRTGVAGHDDLPVANATFDGPAKLSFDAAGDLFVLEPSKARLRKIVGGIVVTWPDGFTPVTADSGIVGGIAAQPDGNGLYYTSPGDNAVRRIAPGVQAYDFAGTAPHYGHVDGAGANARFIAPGSMAADSQGNVFVVDNGTIRRITPAAQVTTLASGDFRWGDAVAFDAAGTLYASSAFCPVFPRGVQPPCTGTIQRISPAGAVMTLAISSSSDGTGTAIERPTGLALDAAGNLYIADRDRKVVRKLTPAGDLTTVAGVFSNLSDLAIDRAGNLYLADGDAIRKIAVGGAVTTFAGSPDLPGYADGAGEAARFAVATALTVDADGNLYVADTLNHVVRKVTAAGIVTTVAGTPGVQGAQAGSPGVLSAPAGVAIVGRTLYIASGSAVMVVRDVP